MAHLLVPGFIAGLVLLRTQRFLGGNLRNTFFYFSSRSMSKNHITYNFVLKYANYVAETALHVEIVKMMTLIFASLKPLKSLTQTKTEEFC